MDNKDINIHDLELPYLLSEQDNGDHFIFQANEYLVVGYLADDIEGCENPLTMAEGMGALHKKTDQGYPVHLALALNSDDQPELNSDEVIHATRIQLKEILTTIFKVELATAVLTSGLSGRELVDEIINEIDYENRDKLEFELSSKVIEAGYGWERVATQEWKKLRASGEIGNINAVLLDQFDNGLRIKSDQTAIQCDLIWVPDKECLDTIKSQAPVFAHYWIEQKEWVAGQKPKFNLVNSSGVIDTSDDKNYLWGKALKLAKACSDKQLATGHRRALLTNASANLEIYNEWIKGDTFDIVIAHYVKNMTVDENPDWVLENSEIIGGYIGRKNALDELLTYFDSTVLALETKPSIQPELIKAA
ncbi:MAG: hypothetical protein KGI54_05830 [Pseudomonadota bacterium]|nr:hypothetical protein [Pseudomonadota bacterium]